MQQGQETGDESDWLSIGDMAQGSGIAPDTIRVWERRYGRPTAVRLPSGHRRYSSQDLSWLRQVAEAIGLGIRANKAVTATQPELEKMLRERAVQAKAKLGEGSRSAVSGVSSNQLVLDLLLRYQASKLRRLLMREYRRLGPEIFLESFLGPLLNEIGRAWAKGKIHVRHEHFFSEIVEDFLRARRYGIRNQARGPLVLLTTMEGERHGIGLQIAALFLALRGHRTRVLGLETPIDEIVNASKELKPFAVAISVSAANGGIETDAKLAVLREKLGQKVRLLVGGRGSVSVRRKLRGVDYAQGPEGLKALDC